jgi:O6-methylguanine-DNA--protein-cysteine methyltransferase
LKKKILSDEVKSINVIFNNKKKECDDEIYSTISKFFNSKQSSTEDLIRALVEYYKLEKDKNIDYILQLKLIEVETRKKVWAAEDKIRKTSERSTF